VAAATFFAAFASWLGGPPPQLVDTAQTLERYGEEALYYHNELSGSSNWKAKESLSLKTRISPWYPKRPETDDQGKDPSSDRA